MPSRKHQVALRLDDETFEALDRLANRKRWTRAMTAKFIVDAFLATHELEQIQAVQLELFTLEDDRANPDKS